MTRAEPRDDAELRLRGAVEGRLLAGPETLQLNLSSRCNLDCVFCWIHSPLRAPRKVPGPAFLSPGHVRAVLDALPALRPGRVVLCGQGEPLLHPEVRPLLAALQMLGVPTTIQTNGTAGPEPDELAALGVESLEVNLSAATAAAWRDTHPAHARLHAEALRRLERLAELRAGGGPAVTILAVVQRSNLDQLLPLLELAERVAARRLVLKGMELQPELAPLVPDAAERAAIHADLERVRARARAARLELRAEHLERLLGVDPASGAFTDDLRRGPCYMGWYYLRVTTSGEVMFCCKDKLVDHLDRRPLYATWRSAAYHLHRLAARDGDPGPGFLDEKCRRCSNFARNLEVALTLRRGQ